MKRYYSLLIGLLISATAFAQVGSLSLSLGIPQNEFRENTDATGFGFDFSLGFPIQEGIPIYFGGDINYQVYGANSQDENLTAEIRTSNGLLLDELIIPLRIKNTNSIFGTHAFMRLQAPWNGIQPYVEGLVGFRYISTTTKILDRSDDNSFSEDDSNLIVRKTILDDWIFSYGYGGGIMLEVGHNFYLDFRADFFKGQRAKYFDGDDTSAWSVEFVGENAYDPENLEKGDLQFETVAKESTTDMLVVKLGIAIKM